MTHAASHLGVGASTKANASGTIEAEVTTDGDFHGPERLELLQEKREDILRIADRHGAYNVRVFGSVSRGEARPDSDVDILVDVGPKRSPGSRQGWFLIWKTCLGAGWTSSRRTRLHWFIRDQHSERSKAPVIRYYANKPR